ncbi:MAG: cytochrome P450 [Acidimicrobiales bacterium]
MVLGSDRLTYDPLDRATQQDPYPVYRRLRDEDPVHRTARGFWVLSRFEDVFGATVDTETFSSAQGLTFEEDEIVALGLKPTLVMMDRPVHTTFRRLISRGFTPRKVAALEPSVRAFVRARVDLLAEVREPDFVQLLAGPLPTLVVATYLGVPESDRVQFDAWSQAIVSANASGGVVSGAADAVAGLYGYFTDLIEWRRSHPGDDMLSDLTAARVDGEPLALDEILGYCFVMIAGGNDTASGLLGGSAVALTEHPDQRPVLEDPGRLPGAVEELLRVTCPVQGLSRTTTREVAIRGVAIPEASKVHLLYGSANRDPREFGPTADELDLTRAIRRMLTFGNGPHHCIGAAAARLQGRVALEELLAALPGFSVDVAGARLAPGPFVRRYESLPFDPGRRRPRTGRAPGDSPYP